MEGHNWYIGYEVRRGQNGSLADEMKRYRQQEIALASQPRRTTLPGRAIAWTGNQLVRAGLALQKMSGSGVHLRQVAQTVKE